MYCLVYILGLVLLISVPYDATSALFPCCIGTLGIGGMLKYCFPALFKKIKERRLIADKLWLIALSNLYASLRRAVLLIEIYAISSSVMIAIMISQQENPREMITTIIGFIVVILLLLASILYKYTMEATTRHMFYYNLYKLGYTYRQLLSIIKKEVISFYVILIGLPLFYIGITLIRAFLHQGITLSFFITVFLAQILPALLAGILTYISYKNSVLLVLKEGVHYE
jgi:hypothetical protein